MNPVVGSEPKGKATTNLLFALMAPQEDRLTRIGIQSSALIEDSHGGLPYITRRPGRLPLTQVHQHHIYQHQQIFIYHGAQISTVRMPEITSNEVAPYRGTMVKEPVVAIPYRGAMVKEPVISGNEAGQNYGGLEKQPVITSDEAAKYYGGFVIVEHGRKKQFRSAY
ncbi:hypothetical protein POTOM_032399 [Populus tomentosa]|uniref:Uncharacterized protein n=1 Tax=Populus tomentosa TaxID=118781 RepID=A0A8X7ZA33_POPTO|nr:hypothetical protein POTOM_032399 [Populus tomentosa]